MHCKIDTCAQYIDFEILFEMSIIHDRVPFLCYYLFVDNTIAVPSQLSLKIKKYCLMNVFELKVGKMHPVFY